MWWLRAARVSDMEIVMSISKKKGLSYLGKWRLQGRNNRGDATEGVEVMIRERLLFTGQSVPEAAVCSALRLGHIQARRCAWSSTVYASRHCPRCL